MKQFSDKVVYQIYPKSFLDTNNDGIGDIKGIISKLDYLKELGVDMLWLSPICESPQYDNGYDISDYYKIDPIFGNNNEYEELIKEAQKRNMEIMMDLVLNHVSSEHIWFKKALAGEEKYYNYFIWRDEPNELTSAFGGSAWQYVEKFNQYYLHFFDVHQPDLNWGNPEVREEIIKMVNYWIDKGVKGFRLDVIDMIGKEPDKLIAARGPLFYKYLKELQNNTFKKDILTVGECWCANIEQANEMCNDDGLGQIFHFTHLWFGQDPSDKFVKKEINFNDVANNIKQWQNDYSGTAIQVINNHDMPRLISSWFNDDKYRYQSATLACALFHLLSGTSYIYQGEEIGMTNAYMDQISDYNDVESINKYHELVNMGLSEKEVMQILMDRSRDNARTPMQWDKSEYAGFSTHKPWLKVNSNYVDINVEEDMKSSNSIYRFYQEVFKYKKNNIEKINKPIIDISFNEGILQYEKENFKFICNITNDVIACDLDNVILSNYEQSDQLYPYQFVLIEK